jgi:sugar lactone lactonase YvrE
LEFQTKVLVDGLGFPEDPRWHEGKLWFSDMDARSVMNTDLEGNTAKLVEVQGTPSGLGWTPDGELLVVSMADRRLLKLAGKELEEVANLWDLASFNCNDMVVNNQGRAYIGNFGFDFESLDPFSPGEIIAVSPEGHAEIVADNLAFPNGMVITSDEKTLIVSETLGECLTAFDINQDGSLANRRTWAELEGMTPDGITLDDEGAVWVASPVSGGVFRVHEGGEITQHVTVSPQPYACMLGGADRKTLFIMVSAPLEQLFKLKGIPFDSDAKYRKPSGKIEYCRVGISGAGRP